MTTKKIDVFGYAETDPLVHVIGIEYGEVKRIAFHPKHATKIAAAICAAASAVESGEDFAEKGIVP